MAKKKPIKKETTAFLNPFDAGVNYDMVLDSIPNGVSLEAHFKGKLSDEQIEWLKTDLKIYKLKKQ